VSETPIDGSDRLIELTADVVSAYVSNNPVPVAELPGLISRVYTSLLQQTDVPTEVVSESKKPAVPIKKSVTPDYIVCLEDGKQFKSLKRHLSTPMASPRTNIVRNGPAGRLSAGRAKLRRSAFRTGKIDGLGRKPKPVEEPPAAPARRKRLGLKFS
jgi:predicted transcriptional regulator